MDEKKIREEFKLDESIKIDAFQSAGHVLHTRQLAKLTKCFADFSDVTFLASSVIVMAAAALEALLVEAAYIIKPEIYADKNFRYAGVPKKFEIFMGKTLEEVSPDATELWRHRLALTHAEPDARRTRFVGERINPDGALWAADTVEKLAITIWGDSMPDWFANTTGLISKR